MSRTLRRTLVLVVVLGGLGTFLPAPANAAPVRHAAATQYCVDLYPQPDLGLTVCTPDLDQVR